MMMKNRIYLDYAATTPVLPEVLAEMLPYFTENYGNPSGVYATAREARQAVEKARRQVADAIGAEAGEIYFTSGGSESDNMAIRGALETDICQNGHIITTRIEHNAVLQVCAHMKKAGARITWLPVDRNGIVCPEDVTAAIRTERADGGFSRNGVTLLSVMTANNEIGTIEPIREIGAVARESGVLFHTDAVQAIGSLPVHVDELNVDMMSISSHKFYGPKGVGALYVRKGTRISNLIFGGAQERGLRAGTENTAGIVGMGKAIETAVRNLETNTLHIREMRDLMIRRVLTEIPGSYLNGSAEHRLANNCHFSFDEIDGEALLLRLDLAGIAASGGSACTSGNRETSHVLRAIGIDESAGRGSIRFSLGRQTTEEQILETVDVLRKIVLDLRSMGTSI